HELTQRLVVKPPLRQFDLKHVLAWRRIGEAETGEHAQHSKRITIGWSLWQIEHRRDAECGMGLQNAMADVTAIYTLFLCRVEQRVPHCFHSTPVTRQRGLVLLHPERHGGSNLRRCCGRAFAV